MNGSKHHSLEKLLFTIDVFLHVLCIVNEHKQIAIGFPSPENVNFYNSPTSVPISAPTTEVVVSSHVTAVIFLLTLIVTYVLVIAYFMTGNYTYIWMTYERRLKKHMKIILLQHEMITTMIVSDGQHEVKGSDEEIQVHGEFLILSIRSNTQSLINASVTTIL